MALSNVVKGKASSLIVAWLVGITLIASLAGFLASPARAANCSRSGVPTPGDWIIPNGDVEVCDGIVIVMDGNLNVQAGGDLTIRNGGLKFVEDTAHVYGITVAANGFLRLDRTTVWTETNVINPYLQLAVTISGTLTSAASTFAFPGTIDGTAGATLTFTQGSVITRTATDLKTIFTNPGGNPKSWPEEDNDDAPGLAFAGSTVSFYASRVDSLYENLFINFTGGDPRQSVRLTGGATLTAVDTFLGVDFNNLVGRHDNLTLEGASNAYLYGVTFDTAENPATQDLYRAAILADATSRADLYRWADVRVVDANGVPVPSATVTADFVGSMTGPATFRDSDLGANTPPSWILAYLGKTAVTWRVTGVDGTAHMPLLSDFVDATTLPNSRFVGEFALTATSGANTGTGSLTFPAYPLMGVVDAAKLIVITISTLVQPLPDLTPVQPTFAPATPKEGQTVQITAPVANQGAGGAANVLVRVYDGNTLLRETTIPFIAPAGQQSVSATLANATAGQHVIRVWADPNGTIIEGPTGSPAETNNLRGYPLGVTPLGPDLAVSVSFTPDPGFLNNPVGLNGNVVNGGDRNATSVQVNFYVQGSKPTSADSPVGIATIPFVQVSGGATATLNWTPTGLGDFTVWAWVDPTNQIPEPAPYSKANNLNSAVLRVNPAPDLVTFPQDLSMLDPFPRVSQLGNRIEAVVRNNGQALASGFQVEFLVDGSIVGTQTNAFGLNTSEKWVVPSLPTAPFATCGAHTIGINVDSSNLVPEGSLYELNNNVTATVQVYPNQVLTWSAGGTITADQAFSSSIEVNSAVTVSGASIMIVQDSNPCGRYYVKVLPNHSLTLVNAQITSNWPLVIFVAPGGTLTAVNTTFQLDNQGAGVLHSKGTLDLRDSTVFGDVIAKGTAASLRGDTFDGALLHVDTTSTTRLWDSTFPGVTTLELTSDVTPKTAPDFDIRNATFNAGLTAQLVFSGTQWAALTSVHLTRPGDWWSGLLTQNSHVTVYWWLTIEAVDGTGTRIEDPSTSVDLKRFNPTTLAWDPVAACTAGNCYGNANNSWMVAVPQGALLYRAAAEDRYGPLGGPPAIRATYQTDGWAFIEGQPRKPDQILTALVTADTTMTLTFSALTPDLNVTGVAFNGMNGVGVNAQPLGEPLTIVATIQNLGQIITRSVIVYFFAADVDGNRDGVIDNPPSFYIANGLFIGSSGPSNVSAGGSRGFPLAWTPTGTFEGTRTVSAVVDAYGNISELNERNNIDTGTVVVFAWPDIHLAGDPVLSVSPPKQIANNDITIVVNVTNQGTNDAARAIFGVFETDNTTARGPTVTATVPRGATIQVTLVWRYSLPGLKIVRILARAAGGVSPGDYHNWDFDLSDNYADKQFDIFPEPELSIAAWGPAPTAFRGAIFEVNVTVTNSGSDASNVVIGVWAGNPPAPAYSLWIGVVANVTLLPGPTNFTIATTRGLLAIGLQNVTIMVDANNTVNEPNENNNVLLLQNVTVLPPNGRVLLDSPFTGTAFKPGDPIAVSGSVIQNDGSPIPDVTVTFLLTDPAGNPAAGTPLTSVTPSQGTYFFSITAPAAPEGTYHLQVTTSSASIQAQGVDIEIRTPTDIWHMNFLGLPFWIWLIVIIGAAAAIGGGTAYVKFVGLGKLVECGECGSFIPEDSTKCPKCGVEFATGEVEMADYEAQMRKQYDEVKRKFRDEAGRELGRSLSDKEFEDWWRTQPTFVTFEDWLREEEEMRRMGSKPCPVCNTLNSVTATVCHKCGTLLKEEVRKPGGGRPPAAPPGRAVTPAAVQPAAAPPEGPEAAGMPTEAIPKKVVKKPVVGAPLVQKKVIKRPLEEEKKEGEEGMGGDEGEQI